MSALDPSYQTHRILLIDDNPVDRTYVDKILTKNGFKVILAENGETGIAAARQEIPDLILLDILLPHISGIEVCKKLKDDQTIKHIPVVFFSNIDAPKSFMNIESYGAVDFISKSVSPVDLVMHIKMAINRNPRSHHNS